MRTNLFTVFLTLLLILADYFIKKATMARGGNLYLYISMAVILYALSPFGWFWILNRNKLLTVGALYSVFTVSVLALMGYFIFGEKISSREGTGLILALASIILLSSR